MAAPLCIELFCGSFGWSAGWLELGGHAIGFDIEHLPHHGPVPPGAELVLQNVLTIHGSQFRNADLILASPPCTEYSYMAMPWSRAKQISAALCEECPFPDGYRGSRTVADLRALFDACFRIQREACEAAGRYIPMVVENVKGAQPWVGPAKAKFGSFYLWGSVESIGGRIVASGAVQFGMPAVKAMRGGQKITEYSDPRRNGGKGAHLTSQTENDARKNNGGSWFNIGSLGQTVVNQNPVNGVKHRDAEGYERDHPQAFGWKAPRTKSGSSSRKAASAQIARIPLPLSQYIAQQFKPCAMHATLRNR